MYRIIIYHNEEGPSLIDIHDLREPLTGLAIYYLIYKNLTNN